MLTSEVFRAFALGAYRLKAGPRLLVIDYKATPSRSPNQANSDMFNATLWFSIPK